jgi:hypothetical protein
MCKNSGDSLTNLRITFMYFEGCPHAEDTLSLLKDILKELELNIEPEIVEIRSQRDAEIHAFPGSPTIKVNGRDIEGKDGAFLGCRVYKSGTGVPPKDLIVNAILNSL